MARTPANPAVASLVACCWPTLALDRAGIAAPTGRLRRLDDAHLGDELAALFAPKPGMS